MRTMAEVSRVVVVDDHPLLAQMLVDRLCAQGFDGVALGVDDPNLAETIRGRSPDLVLLDAIFDDDEDGGMRVLRALRASHVLVAMLTGVSDEIRHAEFLEAGAIAVLLKSNCISDVLAQVKDVLTGVDIQGITRRVEFQQMLGAHRRQIAAGEGVLGSLTDRERATLQSLVDGVPVEEIAYRRAVALSTVRSQIRAIFRKFDANSQIKAVAIAVRHGMHPSRPV